MNNWHEAYETIFDRALPDEVVQKWEAHIRQELNGVSLNEFVKAVRELGEKYALQKLRRKPTASDIVGQIKAMRKAGRHRSRRDHAYCAFCRAAGWISFCGWLDSDGKILQFGNDELRDSHEGAAFFTAGMGLPCLCSRGRAIARDNGINSLSTAREVKAWISGIPDDSSDPDYRWRAMASYQPEAEKAE